MKQWHICEHATSHNEAGVVCGKGLRGGKPSHNICNVYCDSFTKSAKPTINGAHLQSVFPSPPAPAAAIIGSEAWGPRLWRKIFLRKNPDILFVQWVLAKLKEYRGCGCYDPAVAYVAAFPPVFGIGWFEWVWAWKNHVNRLLGKPMLSLQAARDIYFPARPENPARAIIVGRWFGLNMRSNARDSMRAAANRWGVDYVELTKSIAPRDPHGGSAAFAEKLQLDRHAAGYGQVLYLDADMIVRSDCPSPFDLVPIDAFGVVSSDQPGHENRQLATTTLKPIFAKLDMDFDPQVDHFNGGFYLFSPIFHSRVFEDARALASRESNRHWTCFEEGYMSAAIKDADCPVTRLPITYNRCGGPSREWWKPEMQDYIQHYAGGGTRDARMDATIWDLAPGMRIQADHGSAAESRSTAAAAHPESKAA